MQQKEFKWSDIITNPFYYKVVWVMIGMLTIVPAIRIHVESYIKVMLIWGAVILAVLFLKRRIELKSKEAVLLILFCVSYFVTILLNRNHLGEEISMLAYSVLFFFVLTYFDVRSKKETAEKELRFLFKIVVVFTFIYSCIAIGMFFMSVQGMLKIEGIKIPYGMWEERLWGLYNPNTGSVLNYTSIIFSGMLLHFEKPKKAGRAFLIINIVLQTACYSLTQSRGAAMALYVFTVLYVVLIRKPRRHPKKIKESVYRLILAVLAVAAIHIGSAAVLKSLDIVKNAPYYITYITQGKEKADAMRESEELKRKVNTDSVNGQSSGRTNLWKIGFRTFKESPVLGKGFSGIEDAFKEHLTKKAYKNSANGGLHNIYITLLVSGGAAGLLLMLGFLGVVGVRGAKCIRQNTVPDFFKMVMLFFPAWLVGDLVESRIILSTSWFAILFWIMTGYIMYIEKTCKSEVEADGIDCSAGV